MKYEAQPSTSVEHVDSSIHIDSLIRNPALQQNSKHTTAHSFGPVWIFKIRDVTSKFDEKLLQPWASG